MPYVAPARPSIRIVKSFQYRGAYREFGNRWFFNGGTPADHAHWDTLAAAVLSHEQNCYSTRVTFQRAVCYASGSDVPIYTHTYSASGSYTLGTGEAEMPGDCAGLVRISTTARSVKNHPIYLYKFLRACIRDGAGTVDTWSTFQAAHWKSLVDNWIAGLSDGTLTLTLSDHAGLGGVSSVIEPLITHRDFPR